jgi:hypothetical protein
MHRPSAGSGPVAESASTGFSSSTSLTSKRSSGSTACTTTKSARTGAETYVRRLPAKIVCCQLLPRLRGQLDSAAYSATIDTRRRPRDVIFEPHTRSSSMSSRGDGSTTTLLTSSGAPTVSQSGRHLLDCDYGLASMNAEVLASPR